MVENLSDYLRENEAKGFQRVPSYSACGDYLTYFFKADPAYAVRIDDLLTVYRSKETKELVGCKIKGVRHILKTAGDFGILLGDEKVRLALFFFVGAAQAKDRAQAETYDELRRLVTDATLDRSEIQPAIAC